MTYQYPIYYKTYQPITCYLYTYVSIWCHWFRLTGCKSCQSWDWERVSRLSGIPGATTSLLEVTHKQKRQLPSSSSSSSNYSRCSVLCHGDSQSYLIPQQELIGIAPNPAVICSLDLSSGRVDFDQLHNSLPIQFQTFAPGKREYYQKPPRFHERDAHDIAHLPRFIALISRRACQAYNNPLPDLFAFRFPLEITDPLNPLSHSINEGYRHSWACQMRTHYSWIPLVAWTRELSPWAAPR